MARRSQWQRNYRLGQSIISYHGYVRELSQATPKPREGSTGTREETCPPVPPPPRRCRRSWRGLAWLVYKDKFAKPTVGHLEKVRSRLGLWVTAGDENEANLGREDVGEGKESSQARVGKFCF